MNNIIKISLLVVICLYIYSCQESSDKAYINDIDKKERDITILIKGNLLKDTIQHKDGSSSKNLTPILTYSGADDVILPINEVSKTDSSKTVKIVKPKSNVILQRKIDYDDFDFLILQPGDSIEISLSNTYAHLLNRKALKYDVGLSDLNEDLPISRSESYNRNRIFLLDLLPSQEHKVNVLAKHRMNVEKAKNYYQELLERIDSVYQLNQMTEATYEAYKTYYTYKGQDGNIILDRVTNLSPIQQDSVFKYSYFRAPLYTYYSRLGYKDIVFASGRGIYDYKVALDSVLADKNKLSHFTSDLLLYEFMGRLAQSTSSSAEVKDYFEKFKENVHDTTLISALSANYFFDDIHVDTKNSVVLTNIESKKTNLSDVLSASNDSLFYIDFWASWCRPCIAEMPASEELKLELQDQPISVIYLSIDKKIDNWERSASRLGLDVNLNSYLVVNRDSSKFLQDFILSTIPRYLVVNKKGKLLQSNAPSPSSEGIRKLLVSLLSKELN